MDPENHSQICKPDNHANVKTKKNKPSNVLCPMGSVLLHRVRAASLLAV